MRLIDADALTEYLKCLFPERGMWEIEGDTAKDAICETVVEAMEMVKNMETIKPKPERKTGKWIDNSPVTMKCDQCGIIIKDWDWHRFKICPGCGARMCGGEQDDR